MGRLVRLVDAGINLIESAVERFADPERVRYLEHALRQADARIGELARENARLEERLESEGDWGGEFLQAQLDLRREDGCAPSPVKKPQYPAVIEANRQANREVAISLGRGNKFGPCQCFKCLGLNQ